MEKNNNDMAEALKIRLAARCESAGRPENEDNFQVAEDLSVSNTGFTTDKVFSLGSKGALLLVCDGMGGMNAGEVASAVGVETIKNLFAPQILSEDIFANDDSVCMYMKRAIVKADNQIKEEASKDAAKQGMGSTVVMAWLLNQKVYVAWCGDSRCYRYNPATGLEQLSHDHSYVQCLVDTGQLSAELAFDHPNKNIITRSLGDPRGAARPDAKVYNLHVGDVIMLCSDGLSDSLRDNEIELSISRSVSSMTACRDALWNDSKQAGWHDNVTVVLAQVMSDNAQTVDSKPVTQPVQQLQPVQQSQVPSKPQPQQESPKPQANYESKPQKETKGSSKKVFALIVSIIVVIVLAIAGVMIVRNTSNTDSPKIIQLTLEQVQPQIDEIINAQSTDMSSNMEAELLKIANSADANVKKYIGNKLEEKSLFIEGKDDFLGSEEVEKRIKTINEIKNKIEKL